MNDISFGPNLSGNYYKPVHYHQRTSKNKNKSHWCISPKEQYDLFNLADERVKINNVVPKKKWKSGKFLYSFRNGTKDVIGTQGERIGKFDPGSVVNEWHGYPERQPTMDKALIEEWFNEGLISAHTKQQLIQRRI